jgi:hypothetical protein
LIGLSVTSRMRRMTSAAIAGVAWVSATSTASSPMTMPVFGSPSAVYAQACSLSWLKVTFFSSRSAWEANFLGSDIAVSG